MLRGISSTWILIFGTLLITSFLLIDAAPYPQEQIYLDQLQEDPQALYEILSQFDRLKELENKRGLDFGLNRGYSGSQTAKHLMGMAAANFANGPGRRRRSELA